MLIAPHSVQGSMFKVLGSEFTQALNARFNVQGSRSKEGLLNVEL
jgi:hypothetical protein